MINECRLFSTGTAYQGKQGQFYYHGISKHTVGSEGICMHLLHMLPGARAIAHLHRSHETALYMLDGEVDTWWGDNLQNFTTVIAGEQFYIPANVPHLPWNRTKWSATCIISRTDPDEQESVIVLPELNQKFLERINQQNNRKVA